MSSSPQTAIATVPPKPLLLERMASDYGMDPVSFKSVLLKTVFPQDKQVTMEQLAMFCIVAHNYKLNPLLREIYAFPAKGGGIVPVLGYDGWVTIIQAKEDYDGCEYEYIWEDDKVGKKCIGVTCSIYRRKHSRPTKKTVWMDECFRDTEQWKKKPIWMLEIKALIQSARLAYGFGGIYDQDEAENIIEAQMRQGSDGVMRSEIQMPQRQTLSTASAAAVASLAAKPAIVDFQTVPADAVADAEDPAESAEVAAPVESSPVLEGAENLFDGGAPAETPAETSEPVRTIGKAKAQRIHAIATTKKTRTDAEFEELKRAFKITNLADLPEINYPDVEKWVAKTE